MSTTRKMVIETNFNHKLASDIFVHITVPPAGPVTESSLLDPVNISVKDDPTFEATVRLIDLRRLTLGQLCNADTFPSHGLPADSFKEWWLERFPGTSLDTPMAVYYFENIAGRVPAQ